MELILYVFQDYVIKVTATSNLLSFGSLVLGEASNHAVRMLQLLCGEGQVARNRCLLATFYQPEVRVTLEQIL